MTIARLFESIAVARLQHRCVSLTADRVRFRMGGGEGDVILSNTQWDALGSRFRDAVRPSARALFWALVATIPFGILLCAVIAAVPGLAATIDALDAILPGLSVLLVTSGLPLFAMARHMIAVQRAVDMTRGALATCPRIEASVQAPRKRALQFFEIAALVLVGPHLVIQTYGSLNPQAFRNTPWAGTHLDISGIAGFVVLAALGLLHWMPSLPGRRVDRLARPREAHDAERR